MAKFLDVLHVMARQQRNYAMFLVVNAEKFTHPFLADDIQANCRLIRKQDPRLMKEGRNQFHLHSLA